ncbi:MAG: hypothetical protein ISS79_04760, partial [Phycisphaerae bacterium]|nr:hypothetical protein [Phycisphaerae bacterium]
MESQTPISLSFDRGTLLLRGLERKDSPNVPGSSVWMWDTRLAAWRCDAIYYCRHGASSTSIRSVLNPRYMPR